MIFSALANLNYRIMYAAGSLDPSECCATAKGVHSCELLSEIAGTRAGSSVERKKQRQYEIRYHQGAPHQSGGPAHQIGTSFRG